MEAVGYKKSAILARAGFRHAFFTRHGGVSTGPYASLSFSYAATDTRANVTQNLLRAAHVLKVPVEKIYFLSQVHGTVCQVLQGDEDREEVLHREGDAVVSGVGGVACGVRTADCVPVLLAEPRGGAVAAVHAGWRGVEANIVAAAVKTLRELAGHDGRLLAAIGPHISLQAFEVGAEVAEQLRRASPVPNVVDWSFGEKPHVDLRRIVRGQLHELGLAIDDIDDVPGCTVLDQREHFSYRRDGKASGRHLSAIVPRG